MTKRRVESDLDELSTLLEDLSHDDRLVLTLEAAAADEMTHFERLFETCPTRGYRGPDLAFERRCWEAYLEAMQALYDLQGALFRFRLVHQRWTDQRLWELLTAEGPPEPETMAVSEPTVAARLADCEITYRAYARFATDVLGVDLATWLEAIHPHGPAVVEAVVTQVEYHPDLLEQAEADLRDAVPDEADPPTLDDIVDEAYAELTSR